MKTDLSKILTVSGQHGLFLFVAQGRNGIITEALSDRKRISFDLHSKVNSLSDIAIYTAEGELKLSEVFLSLDRVLKDRTALTSKSSPDELKAVFAEAVPNYDADRFYVSHMKKIIDWYNELIEHASLDFVNPEEESSKQEADV